MTLDLQQLYAFRTIAALGHMTQAASQLALSQPALSRSLARLEEELGFRFSTAVINAWSRTRAGRIFLEHLDQGLQSIEAGRQQALDLIHPERGVVSLSFLHSQGTHLVPSRCSSFPPPASTGAFGSSTKTAPPLWNSSIAAARIYALLLLPRRHLI